MQANKVQKYNKKLKDKLITHNATEDLQRNMK